MIPRPPKAGSGGHFVQCDRMEKRLSADTIRIRFPVSYTHLTLPTIYSV